MDDETDELVVIVEKRRANALNPNRGPYPLLGSAGVILYLHHQPIPIYNQVQTEPARVGRVRWNLDGGTHRSLELHPFSVLGSGGHLIIGGVPRLGHGRFTQNPPPGFRDVRREVRLGCHSLQIQ
jgi:hypothetical protein